MNQKIPKNSRMLQLLKALAASYVITALMLFIFAFLLYKLELSSGVVNAGITITYIVSSFIGGLIIGKCVEQKRFIWGLILGVLYFIVLLAVSLVLNKFALGNIMSTVTVFIMCSLGGMLGGMVS